VLPAAICVLLPFRFGLSVVAVFISWPWQAVFRGHFCSEDTFGCEQHLTIRRLVNQESEISCLLTRSVRCLGSCPASFSPTAIRSDVRPKNLTRFCEGDCKCD
jgi:hypothetical protein